MAPRAKRGQRVDRKRAKRRPARRRPAARRRTKARSAEKRKALRIQPFVVPCRVHAGALSLAAYLTDLSAQGARVSSNDPLGQGVRSVTVEVRFTRASPVARLPARVRWRKPGRREAGEAVVFGITFGRMPRADQALLRAALLEFRRRAALVA
jgi:hypothetical protein